MSRLFICLAVAVLLGFAFAERSLAAAALDPARPPGGNFDLSHWYLTIPDSSASIIPPAELVAGYTNNPWFYTGTNGAMVFWCPVTGGTTSNSSYPRSELRERLDPTTDTVNWTAYGTHILDAQCKVTQVPSSGKVIIGQIHSFIGKANPLIKLQYANGLLDALVKDSPNASSDTHYVFSTVGLNNLITYQIKLVDGLLSITVNGTTRTANVFQSDPDWANQTFYFKAGSYCQDNSGSVTEGSRVEFSFLEVSHAILPGTPPAAPDGLSATAVSNTRIDLRWRNNAVDATGFLVERSTNGIAFRSIASVGSNVTSYANTGLLAGATWFYRVAASNVAGVSPYSDTARATTPEFISIRINFQPASAAVPAGHLVDSGLVYGDRTNGLTYGWNVDGTGNTRDRDSTLSPDQRYDTFIYSQKSSGGTVWEIALSNDIYSVLLVAGDANNFDSAYKFNVEGAIAINDTPTTTNRWISGAATVTVSDGHLTVSNAPGSTNNKICFIDITRMGPLLACPPDKLIRCGTAWDFDVPTASGEADGTNVTITIVSTLTNAICAAGFTATRTWQAADTHGNHSECSQTVSAPPQVIVAGQVLSPTNYPATTPSYKPVSGVTMDLTGSTNMVAQTTSDGAYAFALDAGGDVLLTPGLTNNNPAAVGVTTVDISLIRRHILNIARLDSPYKLLAADVNGSRSVTTLDISLVRRMVLGITNPFPAGPWRFVPSDYVFPDPENPWDAPAYRSYTGLSGDVSGQDFVGIKLGDVNNSWTPPGTMSGLRPAAGKGMQAARAAHLFNVAQSSRLRIR